MKVLAIGFAAVLVLAGILWLAVLRTGQYPSPLAAPRDTTSELPLTATRAPIGKKVFDSLGPKSGVVQVTGFGSPSVRLVIHDSKWDSLSSESRIDLTYYVESLVPKVRANPEAFLDMPRTAPFYRAAVEYARKTCDECWEILVGRPTKSGVLSVDISWSK